MTVTWFDEKLNVSALPEKAWALIFVNSFSTICRFNVSTNIAARDVSSILQPMISIISPFSLRPRLGIV